MKLLLFIKKSMFFRLPTLNLNLDLRSIQFVPFCNISYTSNNISAATIILKNFFDILFTSEIYFICISYNIFLWKSFNTSNNKIYFLDILTFLIHNDKIIGSLSSHFVQIKGLVVKFNRSVQV